MSLKLYNINFRSHGKIRLKRFATDSLCAVFEQPEIKAIDDPQNIDEEILSVEYMGRARITNGQQNNFPEDERDESDE